MVSLAFNGSNNRDINNVFVVILSFNSFKNKSWSFSTYFRCLFIFPPNIYVVALSSSSRTCFSSSIAEAPTKIRVH